MNPRRYDYRELQGDIRREYGTQGAFAKAMGMADATLSLKLNNKAEWSQDEMTLAIKLLHVGVEKIEPYFFTLAV